MMEQMRPLYEALNIFVLEFYLRLVKKNVEMTTLQQRRIPPEQPFRPALDDCD